MPTLSQIQYPVFRLKSEVFTKDKITYAITQGKIIDNKNLEGDTLAKRRLMYEEGELAFLGEALFMLSEVNSFPSGTKFIDSEGTIFKLNKKKFYSIKYYKISDIQYHSKDQYTTYIRCEGINKWIKYRGVTTFEKDNYVGIMLIAGGYLIYDYVNQKLTDSRRKL